MHRHSQQPGSGVPRALPSRHLLESLARFGLIFDAPSTKPHNTATGGYYRSQPESRGRIKDSATPDRETAPESLVLDHLTDSSRRAAARPCIFITGASGAGKSSLLRAVRRRLRSRAWTIHTVDPSALRSHARARQTVADLFDTRAHSAARLSDPQLDHTCECESPAPRIDRMLSAMALAGLSDATLLASRARELSEGQRWRLALALALVDGQARRRGSCPRGSFPSPPEPPRLLIADEFCSTLDRATAWALCAGLARARRRNPDRVPALLLASAHDDLIQALEPDLVLRLGSHTVGTPGHDRLASRAGGR